MIFNTRPWPASRGHAQRGFTLIELVVAFALMAMVLTLALAVSARAYTQIGWSGSAAEASQWAQSLADEVESQPLVLGRRSGSLQGGRYQWVREVSEFDDPQGVMVDAAGRPLLWRSTWEVKWRDAGRDHVIRLLGLHPAPALPDPAP